MDKFPPNTPLSELAEFIISSKPQAVQAHEIKVDELILHVSSEQLISLITFLRDNARCQFTQLMDICGVDWPEREQRFDVVYNLLSVELNQRIRLKIRTSAEEPVPSVVDIFPTAGWFEREVWDMYGVMFSGNPDLRRILTDYGFDGHPQRRDFPLTGYVEVRYDMEKERVVYEPVKLNQAYRSFDFLSPWEGSEYALPGDEKAVSS